MRALVGMLSAALVAGIFAAPAVADDGPLPSHEARKPVGRIAIANSDSAPRAYVDSAMDMAWRAVCELLGRDPGPVAAGVDGVDPSR